MWAAALFTAVAAGSLYTRTLQPTLGGTFNSEEYQYAAYSLSIVHPTGYPLFLLLGKVWVTLVPLRDVAFRMNLFSALWATAAAIFTFFIVYRLTHSSIAGLLAALIFATNEAVWRYASVAEVDTFTAFLFGVLIFSLLLWQERKLPLEVCAFVYGLALVHHRTSFLYAPGILLFILLSRSGDLRSPARALRIIALVLLPLLFYLYIPLRAGSNPEYASDLPSLVYYALGIGAGGGNFTSPDKWIARVDLICHSYLWDWFTPIGIALAGVGALAARSEVGEGNSLDQRGVPVRICLLATFALVTLFTIPYELADIDRYLLVPVMIVGIMAGLGAAQLSDFASRIWQRLSAYLHQTSDSQIPRGLSTGAMGSLTVLVLFLLPLRAAEVNLPKVDMSGNDREYRFWDEVFSLPLEQGAVVIGNFSELNAMLYMQRVEGRRTDLVPVGASANPKELTGRVMANLSDGKSLYLTPGVPNPIDDFHYSGLGPLLRLSETPFFSETFPPARLTYDIGGLTLTGYGLSTSLEAGAEGGTVQVEPNRALRFYLYWRADSEVAADYQIRLRLLDSQRDNLWQRVEPPLRGLYPTSQWKKGEYLTDVHGVSVPAGTPPGLYSVQITIMDGASKEVGDTITAQDVVRVLPPTVPAGQVFVRQKTSARFGPLEFLGFEAPSPPPQPGGRIVFYLVWRATEDLHEDYTLQFSVIDAGGRVWEQTPMPVVRTYPTSAWRQGDTFKEYWALDIPALIAPGAARLAVAVADAAGRRLQLSSGSVDQLELFSFAIQAR